MQCNYQKTQLTDRKYLQQKRNVFHYSTLKLYLKLGKTKNINTNSQFKIKIRNYIETKLIR